MSRLDRSRAALEIAQVGSVIGRVFSQALLHEVSPYDHSRNSLGVSDLVAAGLVSATTTDERVEFTFCHALIRDVAYDSLLRSTRRDLHRRAANALMLKPHLLSDRAPEVVAHHCTEAAMWTDALRYWKMSVDNDTVRAASEDAIKHLRYALARAHQIDPSWVQSEGALRLSAMMIPPLVATFGYASPEVAEHIENSRPYISHTSAIEPRFAFLRAEWILATTRAEYEKARALSQAWIALPATTERSEVTAHAHLLHGIAELYLGALDSSASHLELCMTLYSPSRDLRHALECGVDTASAARAYCARTAWLLGDFARARRLSEEAVAMSERSQVPLATVQAAGMKLLVLQSAGDLVETREWLEAVRPAFERKRQVYWVNLVRVISAWLSAQASPSPNALPVLRDAIARYQESGARLGFTFLKLLQAETEQACLKPEAAYSSLEEALTFGHLHQERYYLPEIYRKQAELILEMTGRVDDARQLAEMGRNLALKMNAGAWLLRFACNASISSRHHRSGVDCRSS